jgi:hypothetical protein
VELLRPRWKSYAKLVVVGGSSAWPAGELAVLDQRLDDRQLEQREVHDHRGEAAAAELVAIAVVVGIARVVAVPTTSAIALREEPSLWMPMCTWSASSANAMRSERALPAERLHDEVGVDAVEPGRVDLALR